MKESSDVLFSKIEFGHRLTKLQVQNRYSNKFISLETGLKNYQALKSGKVVPTVLTLYRLSVFYNVTIEFLVHGQEYNQRKQIPEDSELIEKAKKILELNDEDKYIAMQVIDLIIYKQKYLKLAKTS
jgi:transcriptional regulator with XRE-family HTH domain